MPPNSQKTPSPSPQKQLILPDDVAAQYQVREGLLPIFASSEFGVVDLSTITLEFAERLADHGYLKKLP